MEKIVFAAVSRNYFNMPVWIAQDQRMFADEGLDVAIELYEGVDEVTNRLTDGGAQLAYGITEHVVLDSEAGGFLEIIGGNVNRLPFSLIAGKSIRTFDDLRGKTIGVSSLDAGSSSLVMKLLAARGLEYPRDYKRRAVGPIVARWDMLKSGEIDAGLQGAPLNYIAVDQGFTSLCEPRDEVPLFQFTSLNVDHDGLSPTLRRSRSSCARLCGRISGSSPTGKARRRSPCARPESPGNMRCAPGTNIPPTRYSRATETPIRRRSRR